mgnify:CR=1 FL=1
MFMQWPSGGIYVGVFDKRIDTFLAEYNDLREKDLYYYLQQVDQLDGAHVWIGGRRMVMFSSYSSLGLLKHPGPHPAQAPQSATARPRGP